MSDFHLPIELECLSNESQVMFTAGKRYPVAAVENDRLYVVIDDVGYERSILKSDLRFITRNNTDFIRYPDHIGLHYARFKLAND